MNAPSKILIGEDDIDDQEILSDIIKDLNKPVELHFADTGMKLIHTLSEMAGANLPCLILLDYNMPELTGEEILKRINSNRHFANIPKVVWSTSGAVNYKERCINAGALDYLVKPTTIQSLKDMLIYILSICSL
ncbi:response regulator [Panacibacter ginsenosidivorans]|uniref:response regulator n=1 Tax=Panacibacter ginsenosidivorans TaxID=1813871 RepID=UPI0013155AF7|nr:response regulator [Panacibacter ginsenosidivorans]